MASLQNLPRFKRKSDDPVSLAKAKWKDGRCCWTEQRAERTHSRLRQARREAARTGREPNRRGACVGLAERGERRQPHARASAASLSLGVYRDILRTILVPAKLPATHLQMSFIALVGE